MRKHVTDTGVTLWLSANDTYDWAHRPGNAWPCSTLSHKRLMAQFDSNGLLDLTVNGKDAQDIDGHEFNAITSDYLAPLLTTTHPCWYVCVGQFTQAEGE